MYYVLKRNWWQSSVDISILKIPPIAFQNIIHSGNLLKPIPDERPKLIRDRVSVLLTEPGRAHTPEMLYI